MMIVRCPTCGGWVQEESAGEAGERIALEVMREMEGDLWSTFQGIIEEIGKE